MAVMYIAIRETKTIGRSRGKSNFGKIKKETTNRNVKITNREETKQLGLYILRSYFNLETHSLRNWSYKAIHDIRPVDLCLSLHHIVDVVAAEY